MLTRIDRERVARVTATIDACYRAADAATTPEERARHLRAARSYERTRKYYRTFPLGIWLISASVTAIVTPWGLLAYYGLPWLGVVLSAAVALAIFAEYRRHRRA